MFVNRFPIQSLANFELNRNQHLWPYSFMFHVSHASAMCVPHTNEFECDYREIGLIQVDRETVLVYG